MFTMVVDQFPGEPLDALAIRIGILAPEDRVKAAVRLYAPSSGAYAPPISAEVVLAIAVMKQTGLL